MGGTLPALPVKRSSNEWINGSASTGPYLVANATMCALVCC